MNISQDIQDWAEHLGLDLLSTGGGFDYVFRKLADGDKECDVIVVCRERDGSPVDLDEPACLNFYLDENWTDYISIPFRSARAAMTAMAGLADHIPDKSY